MFIEEVMELVELVPLRDSLVGLPGVDGLSTEQCKRLTIVVELFANPCIIFMDEPTSGLDARAAAIVMRTVRNTVDTRRTVVCTIHQPIIDIFEAFDELFLMKRGGEIYVGPLGHHSSHLISYFENDLYKQDWRARKRVQIFQYIVLKWTLALLIGLGPGLVGFFNNLAVENIVGFKLLLTSNLMLKER